MLGLSVAQPLVSALVEGVCRGLPWPGDSRLRPELAGEWVALHGTLAWSPAQAQTAGRLGLRACPRGRVVGVGRVACWARLPEDGDSVHHFGPLPSWAPSPAVLVDAWPPAPGRCAVFFEDVVPAPPDDPRLVEVGNAVEPWRVPRETEALHRRLIEGAPPPARSVGDRPVTAAPALSGPGPRRRRPPTEDARRIEQRVAGLLPAAWSLDVDRETVAVRDPTGRCIKAFSRLQSRAAFASELVRVVIRCRADNTDELVGHIRRAQPYTEAR